MRKILVITFLLLLAFGYGLTRFIPKAQAAAIPTATQTQAATATAGRQVCQINTGAQRETVNLRQCAGTGCQVIRILTEGERLTVTTAGAWNYVTTANGVTGWLNSNYCK